MRASTCLKEVVCKDKRTIGKIGAGGEHNKTISN